MSVAAAGRSILTSELPLPDRLLLWAMRAWVIGLKQRLDIAEPIRSAFGRYDIPEATELIDALMCIVAGGAGRTLSVECVCHKG